MIYKITIEQVHKGKHGLRIRIIVYYPRDYTNIGFRGGHELLGDESGRLVYFYQGFWRFNI
jgi:hypothetical protein